MPIYYGTNQIDSIYYQGTQLDEVYFGDNLVYSSSKTVELGTNTSFNIKDLYPNLYSKLTADNFFALSAGTASGTNGITMRESDTEREWAGFSGALAKSYNANTGILSFYNYCSPGNSMGARVVMVPKTDKLIDLGTSTSFNVSGRSGYQNFTADNFLILSSNGASGGNSYYPQGYYYSDSGSATVELRKSYNASTGVLSCYIYLQSSDTSGVYNYFNFTSTAAVHAYLMI